MFLVIWGVFIVQSFCRLGKLLFVLSERIVLLLHLFHMMTQLLLLYLLFYLHSMEEFLMLTHTRDIVLVKGTGTSIKDYLYISSAPPIVFALSVLSDAVKQRESGWNMFAWSRVSWANNTQPVTIILDTFGQETSAEVRGDGFWIEGFVHVQKNQLGTSLTVRWIRLDRRHQHRILISPQDELMIPWFNICPLLIWVGSSSQSYMAR